jgi:hypothetical protein
MLPSGDRNIATNNMPPIVSTNKEMQIDESVKSFENPYFSTDER